jgi:hypothetical protein
MNEIMISEKQIYHHLFEEKSCPFCKHEQCRVEGSSHQWGEYDVAIHIQIQCNKCLSYTTVELYTVMYSGNECKFINIERFMDDSLDDSMQLMSYDVAIQLMNSFHINESLELLSDHFEEEWIESLGFCYCKLNKEEDSL